jgi:DNA sulfur modification protein DndD
MLHFQKMILKNFGPYEGTQTIDFTDRSGVTIFWGNNGRGKTTLLNAFRYALFGVVQRRSGPLKNLSEMENIEAASEGEHGFSVALEMTNDSDRYRLVRELKLRDGVTNRG